MREQTTNMFQLLPRTVRAISMDSLGRISQFSALGSHGSDSSILIARKLDEFTEI